ncbi:MAG: heavy metal translocating P-type ATPase [Verrucomicrobiales bacterium]|nr:heavy metal translocating P-type ATPase [Verrucomicrobiales bacterium]
MGTEASPPQTPVSERCAYCSAPLPVDFLKGAGNAQAAPRHYCCYGCRLLGEQRPASLPAAEFVAPSAPTPWFRIGIGVALASQAMLLGFAVNLTPPEGGLRWILHALLAGSSLVVLAVLGGPLLQTAWASARRRRITVEMLFLAGIVGAFGASAWSTISRVGAVYYEVVAVLLVVYTVGRTLTARARERAFAESRRLRDTFDTCRRLAADGTAVLTPVAAVEPGDRVRVFPGEPVPVDGRILDGASYLRETPLTGEPFPVVRRAGDRVLAGSWAEDGELLLEATASGRARRLDELLALVEQARDAAVSPRSGPMDLADRITRWFLPIVLGVSVATFVVWTAHGQASVGLFNALAVLLVACPCALGLATPLGLWNALATLAARGVVVRSGDALERLALVDQVMFDKTGTLSEERQSLLDFVAREPGRRAGLLHLLREVQCRSPHPAARAFAALEPERDLVPPAILSLKPVPARGIEAWIRDGDREHHLRVGQPDWIGHNAERALLSAELRNVGSDPVVAIELDGQLAGLAVVRERVRDSVPETFRWLGSLGCRLTILTGDQVSRARDLVQSARAPDGVTAIEGSLSPADKSARVAAAEAGGSRVAFVGDGVNDAPALGAASVGFALLHGAPLATATADAVLCGDDLLEIPHAIALARRVRGAIRSNLLFAAFYNALGMALAATGRLHPITAALLMVGSSTVVSWRALRSGRAGECHPESEGRGTDSVPAALRWVVPATLLAQIPMTLYLGARGPLPATLATLVLAALAAGYVHLGRRRQGTSGTWGWLVPGLWMAGAMLGPGNLGMLLGWWVDAGRGPVMREGVCLCCQSHHYFSLSGRIPWMYLGMLVGGLPPMLPGLAALGGRLGRGALLGLSAMGMILGMSWGADAILRWAGPGHPLQFLLALVGMTLGMLIGMFFACAAGEAVAAAVLDRQRSIR